MVLVLKVCLIVVGVAGGTDYQGVRKVEKVEEWASSCVLARNLLGPDRHSLCYHACSNVHYVCSTVHFISFV